MGEQITSEHVRGEKTNEPADPREIVGIIPAAGEGRRIGPLPCSKELFPIGFPCAPNGDDIRPRPVCEYLLEEMVTGGARKAFIVLRRGKWDIPDYLGDGHALGVHLAYLIAHLLDGVPFTVNQAYPFIRDNLILFGFPDILLEPRGAFVPLSERQARTGASVVLGLWPLRDPQREDVVEVGEGSRARAVRVKPGREVDQYTWTLAVWTPRFTEFLGNFVRDELPRASTESRRAWPDRDLQMGDAIQAAIDAGLVVETVAFPEGRFVDIGTPQGLVQAVREYG